MAAQKREAYFQAKHAFSEGKRLAEERDSKKNTYVEMSAREQQLVEDFDTKKLKKRIDEKHACVLTGDLSVVLSRSCSATIRLTTRMSEVAG